MTVINFYFPPPMPIIAPVRKPAIARPKYEIGQADLFSDHQAWARDEAAADDLLPAHELAQVQR